MIEFADARVFHEAFWSARDARDWNVGGDRLWFGPERDWFWAGTGGGVDLDDHQVPAEIDPGNWKALSDNEWRLATGLRNRTTGEVTEIEVTRRITVVEQSPHRIEYRTTNTLRVLCGQAVSAWNVLQVPLGGQLTIGLAGALSYRDYLDPIDPGRFTERGGQAVLHSTGERMFKIGLSATVFGGWLCYARGDVVIERTVPVHRNGHYCDGPRDADPASPGDVLQIFEDDGHYGGYTEIEHHSPAARAGESVVDDYRTVLRRVADQPG